MAPVDALQARLTAAEKQQGEGPLSSRRMKQGPIQIESTQADKDLCVLRCDDRMDTIASESGI